MSKMEILAELPKLELADRREIFDPLRNGRARPAHWRRDG
jgi:hypothetical protein